MYNSVLLLLLSATTASLAQQWPSYCKPCQSYGVSPQDASKFPISTTSSENFKATQEFSGCQPDSSNNILQDPSGNQFECTQTQIFPDDTPVTFTCPIQESQMVAGKWTLIIISNNGNCQPIDFMRQFEVVVDQQQGGNNDGAERFGGSISQEERAPDRVNTDMKIKIALTSGTDAQKIQMEAQKQPPPRRLMGRGRFGRM